MTATVLTQHLDDIEAAEWPAELLRLTLQVGVPQQITRYRTEGRSVTWLTRGAEEVAGLLAEHGDKLLYRTPTRQRNGHQRPGTAQVCAALIEGVAAAALVAGGGIRLLGLHFDAECATDVGDEHGGSR